MPHAALWVVQPCMKGEITMLNHVSMPHAALWVVQQARRSQGRDSRRGFNAARGFVGGAATKNEKCIHVREVSMPHAALWVVQQEWVSYEDGLNCVSMPHAALWVVQLRRSQLLSP